MMCRTTVLFLIVLTGCTGSIDGGAVDQPQQGGGTDAGTPDGRPPTPSPDAGGQPTTDDGVAPAGAKPGEKPLADGTTAVTLASTEAVYRIDAKAAEHVAFVLSFSGPSGVSMAVDRWNGSSAQEIGLTNQGAGLRFLSVLNPETNRTYWVKLKATAGGAATLKVTRTPFADGPRCTSDCARLIQMPLPNDPAVDGYDIDGGTYFRYWFGRRDLVMMVRHAGRQMAKAGKAPYFPYDFSQWDGQTPGVDVGSPRHASHTRGKDVDLSLFGSDGAAGWRSFCTTTYTSDGRVCVAGTRKGFDGYETAHMVAAHFISGRVTMSFLDRELIPAVSAGAKEGVDDGVVPSSVLGLYSDGKHIQHWPNHDNHIHVRVSETDYDSRVEFEPPFEAP